MKVKKFLCIFTMITMLIALLPNLSAVATVDSTKKFKLVTSADELVVGAKYLIVGYDVDEAVYYALGDETGNESSGMRSPAELKDNGDGTLSALDRYDVSVYPLVMELSKQYVTSENKYSLKTDTGGYLNAFYYYKKTYAFSDTKSKSLPIAGANGVSNWEPILREDGTVLFKTTKTINSVEQSSYIRFFHYQSGSMTNPAFSGGLINDSNIDIPLDENGNPTMTTDQLTEANIPVKTYLYKEVCAHDEANLTHTEAQPSTCSTHGNIEYYYCSNCCGYLDKNKTEIKLADTVLPLADHTNTTFVPATDPTCSAHGNIDYTYCADCGGYFQGNSTQTKISERDTVIAAVNHSYVDGVCRFCGSEPENRYFSRGAYTTGNGYRYIFAAEYGGTFYAMGGKTEKGMKATAVTEAAVGKLAASTESAVFTEEVSYGESIKATGSNTYYTPVYIKVGQNYLKNNSLTLTLDPFKDTATYWYSKNEYDASGNYVNYLSDDPNSNARICLVTDDGDPYFSMCETTDETHISAYKYGELCSHPGGLRHMPRVEPTCTKDGSIEYWHCDDCGYFSDALGLNTISDTDIPILADGAKDSDNDGICDLCGKTMPVYTKVTSADEIVMGNQYILVSEVAGSHYVLTMPEPDKDGYYYDLGIEMAAKSITPEADGSIKFNKARNKDAIVMKLDFACECSDLDQGTVRYALRTTAGNKVLNLESYGGFCLTYYAKYGWRIALNDDGSAKMSDVYEENLEDWNAGSGKLCVYKHWDNDYNASVFFSSSDIEAHTTENTYSITKWPVYLYRLTETGTINGGLHTYTLNDAKSPVSQSVSVPSASAAAISNISGVSQALTKDAINGFVTKAAAEENVRMNVVVGITASASTEADKETGAGASITYTISPKVNIATDSNPDGTSYDIPDTAFDGSPMKVMLYTGGIDPQQIVHIKQDGTKEYFYPEWSEEVMKNGEKSFVQSRDKNGNMYVTLTVTEFSDIKLLDTPETPETYEFSISDYNEKMGTVMVSCAEAGEYALIFADYEKDRLNDMKMEVLDFEAGLNPVSLPKELTLSSGDKIFLWENMEAIKPLCEAYTIK